MSDSLWPQGLQHSRILYPPLSPGVCSDSCPLSWWCHPTISSSIVAFSTCPQSFPASGSFPVSWVFSSELAVCIRFQSIGTSALGTVLPMNIQGWFSLGLTGLISLLSKGLLQESSLGPQFESINSLALRLCDPALTFIPDYWKDHLTRWTFVSKLVSAF